MLNVIINALVFILKLFCISIFVGLGVKAGMKSYAEDLKKEKK